MNADKPMEFGYEGGKKTVRLKVRSGNLPVTCGCDSDWLSVSVELPYVSVTAEPNYGIGRRSGSVELTDRFGNTITLSVSQDWFRDVRIECLDEITIPCTHYRDHDTYDIYVTVYGGNNKSFRTRGLTKMTEKVWSASGTYQDFIIHIPQGVSGNYTLTHHDANEYEECCAKEGVEPDTGAVKRRISIVQVSEDDMTGSIRIDIGGKHATCGDAVESEIEYGKDVTAVVKKCSYKGVSENGGISDINGTFVSVLNLPDWIEAHQSDGTITFRALSPNPFANERRADIKLSSPSNPELFTTVSFVQKSSAVRG